jgi:AbrB family looped-hinge helix DNA binding protein
MQVQLTRWGNSLGLRVPKDIAERLRLTEGSRVELEAEAAGRIILTPARRRYTLDELLAQCDPQAAVQEDDRAWLDAPAVGRELP